MNATKSPKRIWRERQSYLRAMVKVNCPCRECVMARKLTHEIQSLNSQGTAR